MWTHQFGHVKLGEWRGGRVLTDGSGYGSMQIGGNGLPTVGLRQCLQSGRGASYQRPGTGQLLDGPVASSVFLFLKKNPPATVYGVGKTAYPANLAVSGDSHPPQGPKTALKLQPVLHQGV